MLLQRVIYFNLTPYDAALWKVIPLAVEFTVKRNVLPSLDNGTR